MDNEEYVRSQQAIADGHSSLAVKALEESIEELRSEIETLKEDNARLRRAVKVTRTGRRKISSTARDLMSQIEDMGKHIFDIAAEESALEDSASKPPTV